MAAQEQEQDHGGLDVIFKPLSGVDRVEVEWWGPQPSDEPLVLDEDTDGNYSGSVSYLLVGDYTAVATAYGPGDVVLFQSVPTAFTVEKGLNTSVTLVMHEQSEPGEFVSPYFVSVVMDRALVEQHESIFIEVVGGGGEGELTLSGRHAQSDVDAGTAGSFHPAEGMTIRWHPPQIEGFAWFVLVLTDELGNQAELGVLVYVGPDRGKHTLFCASFNQAPQVNITSRILNDHDASTVYFFVDITDDNSSTVSYNWENDCGFTFSYPAQGHPPSGTFSLPVADAYFRADIPRGEVDPNDAVCSVTLTVSDAPGRTNSVGSAQTVKVIQFDTNLLIPDIVP